MPYAISFDTKVYAEYTSLFNAPTEEGLLNALVFKKTSVHTSPRLGK